jgi:serine/threonine-protein kinase
MLPEGLESHTPAPLSSDGGAAGQQTALLAPASPRKPDLSPLIESFLANYDGGECFLSIPRRISADAAEVLSYGRSAADFERMIERFRDAVGVRLAVEPRPITENQCGALELARHFSGGATPLAIRLAQDQVNDGAVLTADVTGYSHPWIYVLLVDDEGMVRELSSYASSIDGRLRLAVPVHASGDGYDKTQLLIAVSSTRELTMMDIPERAPLANALPLIIGQRKLLAADTEVAVAAFRVR